MSTSLYSFSDTPESIVLHALQQCIDDAVNIHMQQCIVLATTSESGRAPDGVSFISEVEIKVTENNTTSVWTKGLLGTD
jgi:hypothetical protein